MSDRSLLREAALERAEGRCEFPGCTTKRPKLEMAHLLGSQMGGSKYRDDMDNVAMLCAQRCHDVLDSRVSWNQSQHAIATLFAHYVRANPSLQDHHADTPHTTDTLDSAGRSGGVPTSKSSNTESSTDASQPQNTSTTLTASKTTTGQRTSNYSRRVNTVQGTLTSTTGKRGGSTRQVSPQSKSVPSSGQTTATSREVYGSLGINSETPEQGDDSNLTPIGSLSCIWPGCHLDASAVSTESLTPPLDAYSDKQAYLLDGQVDLCDQHRMVLTDPVVPGRGNAVKRLLAGYLNRVVCF